MGKNSTETFLKISSEGKKVIWVWNGMSKLWQNFPFWVNYFFNIYERAFPDAVSLIAGDFNHANLHDCSSEILPACLPACKNALDYCHTTIRHDCQTDHLSPLPIPRTWRIYPQEHWMQEQMSGVGLLWVAEHELHLAFLLRCYLLYLLYLIH